MAQVQKRPAPVVTYELLDFMYAADFFVEEIDEHGVSARIYTLYRKGEELRRLLKISEETLSHYLNGRAERGLKGLIYLCPEQNLRSGQESFNKGQQAVIVYYREMAKQRRLKDLEAYTEQNGFPYELADEFYTEWHREQHLNRYAPRN